MGRKKKEQQDDKKKKQQQAPKKKRYCDTPGNKARRLAKEARKAMKKIRQLTRRAEEGKPFRGLLTNRVRVLRSHADSCTSRARNLGYRG